jgi:hypothetical protein
MHIHTMLNAGVASVGLLAPLLRPVAYLDPGTGSFIIQMLIAAALGGAFLMRGYIVKGFKALFKLFGRSEPTEDEDDDEE